jgi:hypothetical protein
VFALTWIKFISEAGLMAVRAALDYTSTWRAIGVCAIGWLVLIAVQALLFGLTGGPPA